MKQRNHWALVHIGLPTTTVLMLLIMLMLRHREPPRVQKAPPPHPGSDYHHLIDLPDFKFLSSTKCPADEESPLVAIVHSAPTNFRHRDAIRDTWASADVRAIFMVGQAPAQVQRRLEEESHRHGDMVLGSFWDSYRNLTYKHAMALKWVNYHCPGARYVLKTDDDVFIHTPDLQGLIANQTFPEKNFILCDVIKK
jgi:hypothetical protein